jgi:glucose/arabinose dehydrogenase
MNRNPLLKKPGCLPLAALVVMCASIACGAEPEPERPKIKFTPIIGRDARLERPVYLTHDGTDRLFIVEQPGRIRLYENGQLRPQPYLDIVRKVTSSGECGLLSVAFHPKFAENGYLYVNYTTPRPLRTVVSEFKASPKSTRVDASTERVILEIRQPFANHNGGHILFGPDGMLYIGMGDGGAAGDPHHNGQKPDSLLGKILRIDVDQRDPYGVPDDNPFIYTKGFRPEIWAMGLRNPWRLCFDRETGLMYAGDVGQDRLEEIDIIERGGNYGWRYFEGTQDFRREANQPPCIAPIKEYGRAQGISITGGYVYRGSKMPQWQGWYFYADYGSGRVWALKYEDGKVTGEAEIYRMRGQPASFGEDKDGELYICEHNGLVVRLDPAEE